MFVLGDCSDTCSAYSLVVEFGGERMRTENFVSDGATCRALQMVGNDASVDSAIVNFAGTGRPVLLGITERLEYVDAPSMPGDLERYRARGYAMADNRIAIVTDHAEDLCGHGAGAGVGPWIPWGSAAAPSWGSRRSGSCGGWGSGRTGAGERPGPGERSENDHQGGNGVRGLVRDLIFDVFHGYLHRSGNRGNGIYRLWWFERVKNARETKIWAGF